MAVTDSYYELVPLKKNHYSVITVTEENVDKLRLNLPDISPYVKISMQEKGQDIEILFEDILTKSKTEYVFPKATTIKEIEVNGMFPVAPKEGEEQKFCTSVSIPLSAEFHVLKSAFDGAVNSCDRELTFKVAQEAVKIINEAIKEPAVTSTPLMQAMTSPKQNVGC